MGKGRFLAHAMKSKITPFGRWVAKTNPHAICVGAKLFGKSGGGRSAVRQRFTVASKDCSAGR